MDKKHELDDEAYKSDLNRDNPNTMNTPVGNDRLEGMVGGSMQANYAEEQEGKVPDRENNDNPTPSNNP